MVREGVNEGGRMGNFGGLELVEATVELIKEKEPARSSIIASVLI
jgi:hypothetical protein